MGKLEPIDCKQSNWIGLWYHPEYNGYSSIAINLAELKKYKGIVRIYLRKNAGYKKGSNKPNFVLSIKDSRAISAESLELVNEEKQPVKKDDRYYTEAGERLYTYSEVQSAINHASEDGSRGYGWGDNLVEDYL